ncbi:hypothetical protein HYDPIDRAFT_107142 [Hydnomerulius pinastri MD-312]|nr:hypothetical protein HYDPIDRAFT_107142 [Hydnomerulius pinastri MD-312]
MIFRGKIFNRSRSFVHAYWIGLLGPAVTLPHQNRQPLPSAYDPIAYSSSILNSLSRPDNISAAEKSSVNLTLYLFLPADMLSHDLCSKALKQIIHPPFLPLHISRSPLLLSLIVDEQNYDQVGDVKHPSESQTEGTPSRESLPTSSSPLSMELASLSSFTSAFSVSTTTSSHNKSTIRQNIAFRSPSSLAINKPLPSLPPPLITPRDVLFLLELLDESDIDVARQVNQLKHSIRETRILALERRRIGLLRHVVDQP